MKKKKETDDKVEKVPETKDKLWAKIKIGD